LLKKLVLVLFLDSLPLSKVEMDLVLNFLQKVNWFGFGFFPLAGGFLGYLLPMIVLEWCITQPWCSLLDYSLGRVSKESHQIKRKKRLQSNAKTQKEIPWNIQLSEALASLGKSAFLNGIFAAILMTSLLPSYSIECTMSSPSSSLDWPSWLTSMSSAFVSYLSCAVESSFAFDLPPLMSCCLSFIYFHILNDFFLYWGHRMLHEVPWFWKHAHYYHHKLAAPTPAGTVYIDDLDSAIQGGLPIILSMIIVKPHPLLLTLFVFLRVAENVVNHSGIDGLWLHILTLKVLPLRAGVKHHDSHHRFSNRSGIVFNYSEGFWFWDWAFGTFRHV